MEMRILQTLPLLWTSVCVGKVGSYWWKICLLMATLAWSPAMVDAGHSLLRAGSLPSSFPELTQPRIQLVPTRSDQGASVQLYNVPEIPAAGDIPIHCSVTGGTWKKTRQGEWLQQKDVILYQPSRPTLWQPPGISGGPLQARTEVKVAYEVEGLLECTYLPTNLSSNSLVLRFENTSSIVVGLKLPSTDAIYDALEDYSYKSSHKIVARMLSKKTVKSGVNVVTRVTYHHKEGEPDDRIALDAVNIHTWLIARDINATVQYVRSTRYCYAREEGGYSWPKTNAGRTAVPLNPCMGADEALGPKRKCKGDFFQGVYWEETWSDPREECTEPDVRTQTIQNILSIEKEGSLEKLQTELAIGPPLRSNEVILVSRFLAEFARNFTDRKSDVALAPQYVGTLAKVVNRVLDSEREVIQAADDASGASEGMVGAIDLLVSAAAAEGSSPAAVSQPRFAAATSPRGSDILGVAAISAADPSEGRKLVHVPCNASLEDVLAMSPAAAVLLLECPKGRSGVASTIYADDSIFISSGKGKQAVSPVIGYTLVDAEGSEAQRTSQEIVTVLVLFSMENGTEANCSFWDKEKRVWSGGGCAPFPQSELPNGLRGCICTHLTHFAMIISTGPYEEDGLDWVREYRTEETLYEGTTLKNGDNAAGNTLENGCGYTRKNHSNVREMGDGSKCSKAREKNDPLKKLSLISCCVSLAFLLCIFLVAVLYPSWRSGAGRKLQLHLSASLALLMSAYITVTILPTPVLPGFPAAFCVAMGALLHYSLLAAFSWTLVVAVLQALRLSPKSVLDSRSRAGTHLVMKASAFGWGIPLIPVVVTLCWGSALYPVRPCTALCYPEGVVFYATVFAPVTLTIAVNAFVFVAIMRFMFCAKVAGLRIHHSGRDRAHVRRFLFTLFLFVLLGLNWAVGLLLEVVKWDATAHTYIAYVFCSTATLQGTSLFFFFVGCERRVSGKISDDLANLKRKSYDVASRFRRMTTMQSTASDRFSSTPPTPVTP